MQTGALADGGMVTPKDELADEYQDRNRSPLQIEVTPGTNALPPFAVTKSRSKS